MAIKMGQVLLVGNDLYIPRAQTGGPGNLNIPQEVIDELGGLETVGIVRDAPDLSFTLESLDMSCRAEALLCGVDPNAIPANHEFDFKSNVPIDWALPFRNSYTDMEISAGVIAPYELLESVQYRFGVRQNSQQTFGLRGDSIYYVPGTPYYQEYAGDGSTSAFSFTHTPALVTDEQGSDLYAYCVTTFFADGSYQRLFHGDDYTDTSSGFTILNPSVTAPAGSTLHVVYGSSDLSDITTSVQVPTSILPAAFRARNVDLYVSDGQATPELIRWGGVQTAEANWRVTLDKDEELGNAHYVSQDYDVPAVTGSVVLRGRNPSDLMTKLQQIAGVPAGQTVNALSSVPLEILIAVNHPSTGARVKTIVIPDAILDPPAIQPRVKQKLDVTLNFTSEGGLMSVYNGEPA